VYIGSASGTITVFGVSLVSSASCFFLFFTIQFANYSADPMSIRESAAPSSCLLSAGV
jgi:hypothetical protein